MTPLPIDPLLPEIAASLRRCRNLVLTAPPGAGKTTRVPPAVLAAGLLSADHPALVMLQPRRVAARASAERIAAEQGWTIGREVGWHIRYDNRTGPATRLRVLTEGILTRRLQTDPYLEGIGAVILDEFHERSLHTDLALARLKELQATVREDLILLVMSATLEAAPVAAYLGGCPTLQSAGRAFPVDVRYLTRDLGDTGPDKAANAVRELLRDPDGGDVLVFLPGMGEIRRVEGEVGGAADRAGAVMLPLHSSLPADEQDRALRPNRLRKIILSTNIAETSLTIDGVRHVIDTGTARVLRHDPLRGLDKLELSRISKASANQRAGRAGRTGPGTCLRLWTPDDDRMRPASDEPEVCRVDLSAAVLALHEWGYADPAAFDWYQRPPEEMLAGAERLLTMLGALRGGRITAVGRRLLDLPAHPRLGRMLAAGVDRGCVREAAELAALLSDRDILAPRPGTGRPAAAKVTAASDVLIRRDALLEARAARFDPVLENRGIDPAAARTAWQLADELERAAGRLSPSPPHPRPLSHQGRGESADDDTLQKLVLLGYPDRVTRRREPRGERAVMVGGRGVVLDAASTVRDAEFFVSLDPYETLRDGRRESRVRIASAIEPQWLGELFPDGLTKETVAEFDESRKAVVGVARTLFFDLPVREDRSAKVDPEAAARVLAREFGRHAEEIFADDKAASGWLGRVRWLREHLPELGLPAFTGEELAELLAPAFVGCKSLADVRRLPLADILRGQLTHQQRSTLDREAPEFLTVPTGNRLRLTYEPGRPPVLAVRLQEVFGQAETPRLAGGRVAVLLHLLAPNYRPVQVTDDLRSFWSGVYQTVRKELRIRYPKHSWPEDPWTAPPVAKGRPTKR
jgi:ATP-dependent helicase HrpB